MQQNVKLHKVSHIIIAVGIGAVCPNLIEQLTSYHQKFTLHQIHERWIFIFGLIGLVTIAIYWKFLDVLKERLSIPARLVLFMIAALSCCSWSMFYILSDPPTNTLVSHASILRFPTLGLSFALSAGFIGAISLFVDERKWSERLRCPK